MSSFECVCAAELLAYIRGYLHIGGRCHWVLDAVYRENHNQPRDRTAHLRCFPG